MRICFITYGCKVNQAESQKWEKLLKMKGYSITADEQDADCWIINTCAVTHKAEVQSRQIINKAKKLGKKAIVTGCYTELCRPEESESIKVISNFEKERLTEQFPVLNETHGLNISRHRAIVKIQDGCNHFCSYCIVPYLRGKPRSYRIEEILNEIKGYESMGIREIVLSGINMGLYGADSENKINLKYLLKVILKETSYFRIRLSSIELNYIDDEFLDIISDRRICKHLHIPLQHGSDRILSLMNRPYTVIQYMEKIEKIMRLYPGIAIGTDVIACFPSETEEDFRKTLELIEKTGFSYVHVFTYSERPFTKASKMPEQIPHDIRKERTKYLIETAKRKKVEYIKRFIDSELEVIVENKKNGLFSATSDNYIKCLIDKEELIMGDLVKVTLRDIYGEYAIADTVN